MTKPRGVLILQDALDCVWDVIVVGAGMGGCAFGYEAARNGQRVLFVERGTGTDAGATMIEGHYVEEEAQHLSKAVLRLGGREKDPIVDASKKRQRAFVPFIGSGLGGSSALYGMATERLRPSDFLPKAFGDGADSGSWPIEYGELVAWYEYAEDRLRTHGERDPLCHGHPVSPPLPAATTPLTPVNDWLARHMRQVSLHPYRLPLACVEVPGCSTCQGYLCARGCKQDGWTAFGRPALYQHAAHLLCDVEVMRLSASAGHVNGVMVCTDDGRQATLRARIVTLAAGALRTPSLLLRSVSASAPKGIGNDYDLVGRYMMRHAIDLHAIPLPRELHGAEATAHAKQIAVSDFYETDGVRLGGLQSFGTMPPWPAVRSELASKGAAGRLAVGFAEPIIRRSLESLVTNHVIVAATTEDGPRPEHRVTIDPANPQVVLLRYRLHASDAARTNRLAASFAQRLAISSIRRLRQAANNERMAHVCGTCRAGIDPSHSVVDKNGRVHNVDNLFVADASIFPSSGSTNPSLTIAAWALRIAARQFS